MPELRVATYNVNGRELTSAEGNVMLKKIERVDFMCLQEAHNVSNVTKDLWEMAGHTVIRRDECITIARRRMNVRSSLKSYGLVVELDNGSTTFNVHLRLWHRTETHGADLLAELESEAYPNLDQVIIAGDFNESTIKRADYKKDISDINTSERCTAGPRHEIHSIQIVYSQRQKQSSKA
jgi:endonuclease/exonuclease/phosphatase family metal-dependent hydrolase